MKEAKVLTQNDLYLVRRLATAATDLAERCGVNGTVKRRAVRRKKKAPAPAKRVAPSAALTTRPVPRPAMTSNP